jgi:leucyl-tRNA synthetase
VARYEPKTAEPRQQQRWSDANAFVTKDTGRPKYYVLEMFPYPSGNIHMGHARNYVMGDVVARHKRAQGFDVLHPMGWDAFGMPAENAAMERGIHPKGWTYSNIATMREQLKLLGLSLDWSREFATCDPEYYGKQQAWFLELFKRGLVYRKDGVVNWDPVDNTVLANEQVIDGRGWRSGAVVEKRKLNQWFLRITDYADDLIEGLKTLDRWPDKVRLMQENWIGRSKGLLMTWTWAGDAPAASPEGLEIYTTRPDTLFGASPSWASRPTTRSRKRWPRQIRRSPPSSPNAARAGPPGRHRTGREDRLGHGTEGRPSVRRPRGLGLDRQLHPVGIRHGGHLRMPGPRPARPRLRPQIRSAGNPGSQT